MRQRITDTRTHQQRSFFRRLLKDPQQLWLRRAIFQVHLWAGIMLALYVVVIGISGSILVFKEELLPRPHVHAAKQDLRHCTPEALAAVIALVNRTYPDRQSYLASCPDEADPLFAVTARSRLDKVAGAAPQRRTAPLTVYLSPLTDRIIGTADQQHSWIQWVDNLHVYLLMGPRGRQWNGAGAAILLVLVLTGIILWWPGMQRWQKALLLHWRSNWKRVVWNLHSVTGFWTLCFTFTWAMTAIYFAWPRPFTAAISHLSPIVTAQYPEAQLSWLAPAANEPASFDLTTVLRRAQKESPSGALEGCFYGSGPHPIFTVYMARGRMGDYANTDFDYFDQRTGALLYVWRRGQNRTLGDWLIWLAVPLHFGTSWGLPCKILWAALGLALPLLAITGLLMYWNRFLSKRWLRCRPGEWTKVCY